MAELGLVAVPAVAMRLRILWPSFWGSFEVRGKHNFGQTLICMYVFMFLGVSKKPLAENGAQPVAMPSSNSIPYHASRKIRRLPFGQHFRSLEQQ